MYLSISSIFCLWPLNAALTYRTLSSQHLPNFCTTTLLWIYCSSLFFDFCTNLYAQSWNTFAPTSSLIFNTTSCTLICTLICINNLILRPLQTRVSFAFLLIHILHIFTYTMGLFWVSRLEWCVFKENKPNSKAAKEFLPKLLTMISSEIFYISAVIIWNWWMFWVLEG